MSITHEIYESFDEGHEVGGVFLDISKTFDKVWHDVIVFELTQNGISGNLLMAGQWKMNFNADPTKQGQEVIFTRKTKKVPHPPLFFNNTNVSQYDYWTPS